MAKKSYKTIGSLIRQTQQLLGSTTSAKPYIPDIVTFCESSDYLNLPNQPYDIQRIVLKAFYRGSEGNENLTLTPEEIALCEEFGLDNKENGDILGKWKNKELFRELVLVWGRRCLSGDTQYTDPKTGKIWTFQEMWDYGMTDNIQSWTYNEKTQQMQIIPNCNLIFQGKRSVYNIITQSGHEIEATDNHPFLTQRGWVQLKDLKPNIDKVALVTSEPHFGNSDAISESEAALLGYITGDGCCSQRSVFFTCSDDLILKDFQNKLSIACPDVELFKDDWTSAKSKQYQYKVRLKDRDSFEYERYFNEKVGLDRVKRKPHSLKSLLIKHGLDGKTCHFKEVPKALYECPQNVIAAYLNALFSCDGNISSKSNCVEIEFYTVNKKQAIAIQKLLSRFGIFATLKKRISQTTIKVEQKSYTCTSYRVSFSNRKFVNLFMDRISLIKKGVEKAKAILSVPPKKEKSVSNITFSKVKFIIKTEEKTTYDLQVSDIESLQNFTVQGFIAHNSGKDFTISIIALYEAMRLIESPNGDPYVKYGLGKANPFTILTIANSQPQARILYNEIREKFMNAPYFRDKFLPEGLTMDSIWMLTAEDKKTNIEYAQKGLPPKMGSIRVFSGHSNSDSLLGLGCYVLLLDEVASFKQTGGSGSGDRIYTALTPTIKTYARKEKDEQGNLILDTNGKPKIIYDGKIISISSPRGMDGVFYNLYEKGDDVPHRIVCRLPTWRVNPNHTEDSLRQAEPQMTDERFMMEYGAKFSGTAGENFFPPDLVEKCFANNFPVRQHGELGVTYFAHLDPAISSHNYALAIVHKQNFLNRETSKIDFHIIVDYMKIWMPKDGKPINMEEVDAEMIRLNRFFHLGLVTYDQWNCVVSSEYINTCKGLMKADKLNVGDALYSKDGLIQHVYAKQTVDNVPCFEIKTKFGYELKCSANHKLLIDNKFVEVSDVLLGDRVALQDFNSFGEINEPDFAAISGYIVSEGSVYRDAITFHNTDREIVDDFNNYCNKLRLNTKVYSPIMNHLSTKQCYTVAFAINDSRLLKEKIDISNGDCFSKKIPDFVMCGNKETSSSFISTLYEGDGNTCRNPNALLIEYNTASEELSKQLQILLIQFGIKSSRKYYTNKWFNGKRCPFYRISIYGENIDIFANEIGFRSSRKNAELAEILRLKNDVDLRSFYNRKNNGIRNIIGKKASRSRQMWDKIVSIKPIMETICHLEVTGDHTYISNALVSHNSQSSINNLRRAGIPAMEARFNKHYKIKIYDELYALVAQEKLKIPPYYGNKSTLSLTIPPLKDEMLNLQRKFMAQGYRIYPKSEGEVRTDDCCVSVESKVISMRGIVPINSVNIGDMVLAHSGNFRKVIGTSIHKPSVNCVKIQPFYSFPLSATVNHPILCISGESVISKWKNAGDVTENDYICRVISQKEDGLPKKADLSEYVKESVKKHSSCKNSVQWKNKHYVRNINGNSIWHKRYIKNDNNLGFLVGAYVAEGSVGDHNVQFSTNILEKQFQSGIKSRIKKMFGLENFFETILNNAHSISINSTLLKGFLKSYVLGDYASCKELSQNLLHANKDFQIGLLKGMLQGDGSSRTGKHLTFTSTSEILIQQIQYILLRFGVISSISTSKRSGEKFIFPNNRLCETKDLFNLRILDAVSYNKLSTILGYKDSKIQSIYHKPHYFWVDDNTVACQIRKVLPCDLDKVCNIAVEEDSSYVVNGIATHNCDALAGACFNVLKQDAQRLPQSVLANTGYSPGGNQQVWRSMQGTPYGIGGGGQVARNLDQVAAYRNRPGS